MKPTRNNTHGRTDRKVNPLTGLRYDFETAQLAKHADENTRQAMEQAIAEELQLLERQSLAREAQDRLLTYTKFTMPDPENASDPHATVYDAQPYHEAVAAAMEDVERGETPQLIFCMPPRHGKALDNKQEILTPDGWRTHGDLQPGDYVFGPDGKPTKVVDVSIEVAEVVPVTLTNGEVIMAHPNHDWKVYDRASGQWRVMETRDIAKRELRVGPVGRGGRFVLQLPDAGALEFPERYYDMPPYVLGVWLGNGSAGEPLVCHDAQDSVVPDAIEAFGYECTRRFNHATTGALYLRFGSVDGHSRMRSELKALRVFHDKHIPEAYLRGSIEQRLQLLAGLIDTDGHVEKKTGRVRYSTTSETIRDGIYDLATTLGFRPYVVEAAPKLSSSGIQGRKTVFQICFSPNRAIPTKLPRKAIVKFPARRRIAISSVGDISFRRARSICVERDDGLYIVGKTCVVTKNTELATKRFCAWLSGKHPEWNIAVGTYSDSLASDIGADVRNIIASPQHKQVFPDHTLQKGGAAKDNMLTQRNGRLVFVGRGTGLTGKGAHCLTGDTKLVCRTGHKNLRDVNVGDEVLSYCARSNSIVWRTVEAFAERERSRIYRITDNHGRIVEATGDHRFYANGQWVFARELSPGDSLLCAVSERRGEDSRGGVESRPERNVRNVLLEQMLGGSSEPAASREENLRAVRRSGTESDILRGAQDPVLLEGLYGSGEIRRIRSEKSRQVEALPEMQRDVHSESCEPGVLRERLRGQRAFRTDAWTEQPEMEGRSVRATHETAQRAAVSGDAPSCAEAGRELLRAVPEQRASECASHRRKSAEQQDHKSCDAVQGVSHGSAFFRPEGSFVQSVEDTGRDAVVYDIQVAETECFFANGVLTHNCLLLDDLYKDHEEARSQAIRDQAWNWFTKVAMTRRMGRKLVVITMTRWHTDDIIGRLTDPENPHYNSIEARKWKIIRLPALAEEDDPLGREPGEPLWPSAFDADFLASQQRLDPLGFAALYQQTPTVADGTLFTRESIQRYEPHELPEHLRFYAASDHALGLKQKNDPSCFGKGGVDAQGNLWMTELFWKRVPSDKAVEMMLEMGAGGPQENRPLVWWAERGHISKSIGPFLYKRMQETGRYVRIQEVLPPGDKEQRAQSIAARVALGKVYFPKGPLWDKAIEEMLAFPNGLHDDFVDMLSLFGFGLTSQFGRSAPEEKKPPRFGSVNWLKDEMRRGALEQEYKRYGGF